MFQAEIFQPNKAYTEANILSKAISLYLKSVFQKQTKPN